MIGQKAYFPNILSGIDSWYGGSMSEKKIKRLRQTSKIEFTERKSLFIGFSTVVKSEEEALAIIKQKKKEYADATHNVYAYVVGENIARYSDDNEPQGTAGMPVLNSIRMAGISDALVVVTRYFGGILLGAGGLVRAYSTAASMAIEESGISIFEEYTEAELICTYSDYGKLNTELTASESIIDSCDFSENVTIKFAIRTEILQSFLKNLTEAFSGRLSVKILGIRIDTK